VAYERRLIWLELHSFTAGYASSHRSVAMKSPLKFLVLSNVFHATGNVVYKIFFLLPHSHLKIPFCFIRHSYSGAVFWGNGFYSLSK